MAPFTLPQLRSFGKLVAGTRGNIIPANATFDLTLRTFSPDHKERLLAGAFIMLGATTAADLGPLPAITRRVPPSNELSAYFL
ncbi:hypothetical protein [Paenarthrobacter sp. PH39-S1]|uniref:hypothetical protein n=1 Tax=Paenarthrobacter sp. PH39-S1 TaxID=3046204 RepID=UPI0024BA6D03|nr:hypothetical protein [Paenarthrobacter sp. PH39-S1]MDJ0355067.1 hypothetical protein [Paenarthrobacter sp. PH39-S1]